MRRLAQVGLAIIIGLLVAWGASRTLAYALEAPEMQNCGTNRPLFDHAVTQAYAQMIASECREKLERDSVIKRFNAANSWFVVAITNLIGFLVDPINFLITAVASVLAFFGIGYTKLLSP